MTDQKTLAASPEFAKFREDVLANNGSLASYVAKVPNAEQTMAAAKEALVSSLPDLVAQYHNLVQPDDDARYQGFVTANMSFAKFLQHVTGISPGEVCNDKSKFHARRTMSANTSAFAELAPVLRMLGIDTARDNVAKFYDSTRPNTGNANTNLRYFLPEVFMAPIEQGLLVDAVWRNLVSTSTSSSMPQYTIPEIQAPFAVMAETGEASSLRETNWSFSTRTGKNRKYGVKISLTDEVVRYVSMDFLGRALAQVGSNVNAALNVTAVNTLVNGDEAGSATAASLVGVETIYNAGSATTTGIQYQDLVTLFAEASKHNLFYDTVVCDTEAYKRLMEIADVRGYSGETKRLVLNAINIPNINSLSLLIHPAVAEGDLLFVDTRKALVHVSENTGVTTESDRIIEKEVNEFYVRMRFSFYREFKEAAVVLRPSVEYAPSQTNWGANAALTQGFLSR